jgi:hypothetical protein
MQSGNDDRREGDAEIREVGAESAAGYRDVFRAGAGLFFRCGCTTWGPDGRLLFTALEKGAGRCVGIDIDPEQVAAARGLARAKGLEGRAAFIENDVLDEDLSGATVILCYLLQSGIAFLRPKFETELKPGTRIVTETYSIQGWKPAASRLVNGRYVYLYVTPPERTEDYDEEPSDTACEYDWWYWP